MRRIGIVLLLALVLCGQVLADEIPAQLSGQELEAVMTAFMEENGLHEGNFSLSYYNTVTGEAYAFNDTAFMVAASTFKLPLNMYYYEMERDGRIEPDAYIPRAGVTLDVAHRESLVRSNNEYSIGMLYNLGEFRTYKILMREAYFSMPEEEIDDIYYADNYYCTNMMMDALQYLYANSGDFTEMLDYMKQAQPEEYFRAGVTEYEVAHKYGWYEGAVNDVGIIYTEEPFLLAVYTQGVQGETVVADAAALLTAYNTANTLPPEPEMPEEPEQPPVPDTEGGVELELHMIPAEEPEEAELQEPAPELPEEEQPTEEQPEPEEAPAPEPESAFEWWMIPVALVVFAIGGGGAALMSFRSKHMKNICQDLERSEEEED